MEMEDAVGEGAGKGPVRKMPSIMHTYCAHSMYSGDTGISVTKQECKTRMATHPDHYVSKSVLSCSNYGLGPGHVLLPGVHENPNANRRNSRECSEAVICLLQRFTEMTREAYHGRYV